MPRSMRVALPLSLAAVGALAVAASSALDVTSGSSPASAQPPSRAPDGHAPRAQDGSAAPDARYLCVQPSLEIPQSEGCATGEPYPACRWQVPAPPQDGLYAIWRNTVPRHRWGRPGLVSLVLAAAADYRRLWPRDRLTIGDLDAPGPRHQTHDDGVDVDLYLVEAMMTRNEPRGRYLSNYENRSPRQVAALRARVMELARILAHCTSGQIRIYYNDPEIVRPFREWFDARGLRSRIGTAMRPHNRLHEFHFHLTVAEDLEPLATSP